MNKNHAKGNANEEKGNAKEVADKVTNDASTESSNNAEKQGGRHGTVLGKVNDKAAKKTK